MKTGRKSLLRNSMPFKIIISNFWFRLSTIKLGLHPYYILWGRKHHRGVVHKNGLGLQRSVTSIIWNLNSDALFFKNRVQWGKCMPDVTTVASKTNYFYLKIPLLTQMLPGMVWVHIFSIWKGSATSDISGSSLTSKVRSPLCKQKPSASFIKSIMFSSVHTRLGTVWSHECGRTPIGESIINSFSYVEHIKGHSSHKKCKLQWR